MLGLLMCMGSELCCGWLQCNTEHGRYDLQKLWSARAGSVWYVEVGYVKFYCC